jgi:hypothetical protein
MAYHHHHHHHGSVLVAMTPEPVELQQRQLII